MRAFFLALVFGGLLIQPLQVVEADVESEDCLSRNSRTEYQAAVQHKSIDRSKGLFNRQKICIANEASLAMGALTASVVSPSNTSFKPAISFQASELLERDTGQLLDIAERMPFSIQSSKYLLPAQAAAP